jgi:hypothetical protein
LDDISLFIQEEQVGLQSKAQLLFKQVISRVVDIQIDKIDLLAVLYFKGIHERRRSFAGAVPKSKKLNQLQFPGSELHRSRVGCLQPYFQRSSRLGARRRLCSASRLGAG